MKLSSHPEFCEENCVTQTTSITIEGCAWQHSAQGIYNGNSAEMKARMDLSQECTHCGMILGVPVEGYCWPGWSLLKVGKCHHIFCSACAQSSTLQWAPGVPRCLQCENPYHSVVVYAGKPAGLRLRDTTINQADVHSVAYVSFKIPGSASTHQHLRNQQQRA